MFTPCLTFVTRVRGQPIDMSKPGGQATASIPYGVCAGLQCWMGGSLSGSRRGTTWTQALWQMLTLMHPFALPSSHQLKPSIKLTCKYCTNLLLHNSNSTSNKNSDNSNNSYYYVKNACQPGLDYFMLCMYPARLTIVTRYLLVLQPACKLVRGCSSLLWACKPIEHLVACTLTHC